MARKPREYEDDDGRTIADMSGVSRPSLLGHLPKGTGGRKNPDGFHPSQSSLPQEEVSPKARMWYMLGALKAALLIALAFIVGLGLLVLLMLLIWGAF